MSKLIKSFDQYGHKFKINFDKETKFNTTSGGFCTIIQNAFIFWLLYTKFIEMFYYKNDVISQNESFTHQIGVKTVEELEQIPFYNFKYKGKYFGRKSDCAGEDCMDYVMKRLNLQWYQTVANGEAKPETLGPYESRLCTEDEVGKHLYKKHQFWICPPKEKLSVMAN